MKKYRLVSVASTILAMSASIALAAEAVKIGGVEVPADSPLARQQHPRLLFTNAELPAIRRRDFFVAPQVPAVWGAKYRNGHERR